VIEGQALYLLASVLPCPWDTNDDGSVGVNDLLELLANWNACP
jgi:hypothetical protein